MFPQCGEKISPYSRREVGLEGFQPWFSMHTNPILHYYVIVSEIYLNYWWCNVFVFIMVSASFPVPFVTIIHILWKNLRNNNNFLHSRVLLASCVAPRSSLVKLRPQQLAWCVSCRQLSYHHQSYGLPSLSSPISLMTACLIFYNIF